MAKILILYSTCEGKARQIAERLSVVLTRAGHQPQVVDVESRPGADALASADAVIVGGSIRYGHHQKSITAWVKAHRDELSARPNAFYSVCMSAGGPGARPKTAASYIDDFRKRSGWEPHRATSFAGACLFTQYNPFIRFMMRLIMGMAGGETDTTRDWDYTDFDAVDRWGVEFARSVERIAA
jgi:menaquinone-dependent protoporphyrinogen oxidase